MTEEELRRLTEQTVQTFKEMAEYALSGRSPSVVLITFGPEGKTLLGGDPAQIVLELETAKALIIEDCIRQRRQEAASATFFSSMPTAESA